MNCFTHSDHLQGFMVRLIPKRFLLFRWCHKEQGFYEEASMKKLFDSLMCACVRRRHIIHQGWKQHVGSLGRSDEAKKIAKRISSWLYSFMKSIETLDEYKALFFLICDSEEVVKLIGDDTADNIVTFLHSNVFVHEQHFARCFYLDVRRFDAYSNTCLERTNYSLKLGILSHRSKNRTSDSTAWKLALATEADSQYSRRIPYGMIVDQVKIPGLAFNRHR
ncbi:hypothetical protein IV203_028312 [Nitzschia inconspicua]|uniref:Uncharacterized protein n=1 Tax=Nitzschia inconspicua TaxID=303405 RepID=A0A9K3K8V7_9STRA|nr:hypothetical protein IV203_028312 [Nitzschia inconspicua]